MNLTKLTDYLDSLPQELVPGIDVEIRQDHETVFRHWTGWRDRENRVPMNGRELYWIFSATKVFTVTAGMQLIERGIIRPEDPVGMYLPAFSTLSVNESGHIRACTVPLTVRHLFTMTGGFNYDLECPSLKKAALYSGGKADTLTMINALAEEPLDFEPGAHYRYSLCHDVLAAVIESASGLRFSDYLRVNIFEPLGVKRTGFRGEDVSEFAAQYIYDEKTGRSVLHPDGNRCVYRLTDNYESGGAGLYSCVDDYILLADALACGGLGASGRRILKEDSIRLMTAPALTPAQREEFYNHMGRVYSYACVRRSTRTARAPWESSAGTARRARTRLWTRLTE